ncbi:unnamed protein product [Pedinophyceae sp. YPF-701]|nr:unnamed protein product [Pedinophyceae sp. YPF-701]
MLRSLSDNGQVSVLAVDSTRLVAEAASRHGTAPTATAALGRALTGAALLGAFRKEREAVQLNFNGRGELGSMIVIADTAGNAKGYVTNPHADPPLRPDGKLNVGAAVGTGVLSVVRSHPLMKEPFTGVVPIRTGEIAEDIAHYLADSEQTQSAVALGVSLGRDGSVLAAGGFLLSVLPFAEDETLDQLEKNLSGLPSVSELLKSGGTPATLTETLLTGLGPVSYVGELAPQYGPCDEEDLKVRMKRAVATLGRKEVRSIIEEEGFLELTCEFCRHTYRMGDADIEEVLIRAEEFEST